jgi:hypothetical protein
MMAKDPARRYQTGRELGRDLHRLRESLTGVHPSGPPPLPINHAAVNTLPGVDSTTSLAIPFSPRSYWTAAFLLSLVLAAGIGVAIAWGQKSRQGSLPRGQDIMAAGAVEKVSLPNQREQELRDTVDRHLEAVLAKKVGERNGLDLCAELALLYLDTDRLDEAGKLFGRLERIMEQGGYKHSLFGQLGLGIVKALNNEYSDSNGFFNRAFGFTADQKKMDKLAAAQNLEKTRLSPVLSLLAKPRWRYWITRAQWYNVQNGLGQTMMPPYLLLRFPLGEGVGTGGGMIVPLTGDKGASPKKAEGKK